MNTCIKINHTVYRYFRIISLIFLSQLFPSMMKIQGDVPSMSCVIIVLLLLYCIKSSMPNVVGLVDLLDARSLLSHAEQVLRTEPVLGRLIKHTPSPDVCKHRWQWQ